MTKIYHKNFQSIIDIYHHRMTYVNKNIIKIYNIIYIVKCLIFKKARIRIYFQIIMVGRNLFHWDLKLILNLFW